MSTGSKIAVTAVLLLFLGGLAAVDALMTENKNVFALLSSFNSSSSGSTTLTGNLTGSTDSSTPAIVYKNNGPLLADAAGQLKMSLQESKEGSLLAGLKAENVNVYSQIVLKDDDRLGTVTWLESSNVKTMFAGLKEALAGEFSDKVKDLRDETFQEEGQPVRNVLSFYDPAIAEEKVEFIRIGERLYEFHIAEGKEADMAELRALLTQR